MGNSTDYGHVGERRGVVGRDPEVVQAGVAGLQNQVDIPVLVNRPDPQ